MALPVGSTLVLFLGNSFHLLAQLGLFLQILLFLGTEILEVLLVALVDDRRGGLETGPYLLAQVSGHRACLAVLLVQFLQLVEGAYHVGFLGQFLSGFADLDLQVEVLLEVVLTGLAVELEQVVELLLIVMVVVPELFRLLGRYRLDVFPLLLQLFEFGETAVGLLGRGNHAFDLFQNLELAGQVGGLLFLLLLEDTRTLLLDESHLGLEHLLGLVGMYLITLRVAALFEVFLLGGFTLGGEKFVVGGLQVLHLFFGGALVVVGKLFHPFQHLLSRGVYFLLGRLCFGCGFLGNCFCCGFLSSRLCHGFLSSRLCHGLLSNNFCCRLFHGLLNGSFGLGGCCLSGGSFGLGGCLGVGIHYFLLFFLISLNKGIFLRVHHVTIRFMIR